MDLAELLIDLLYHSFKIQDLAEYQYHNIVECIRKVSKLRTVDQLNKFYYKYNYPVAYNPFLIDSQIRFAYVFGNKEPDTTIDKLTTIILNQS